MIEIKFEFKFNKIIKFRKFEFISELLNTKFKIRNISNTLKVYRRKRHKFKKLRVKPII